jgi:hypothetical protein
MTYSICKSDSTDIFTPTYPDGASAFSLLTGNPFISVDSSSGDVSLDLNEAVAGDYIVLVQYSIEGDNFTFTIELTIEDCENYLLENSFSYCTGSGTFSNQLYLANPISGTWALVDPVEGVTITSGGLLQVNTTTASVGSYTETVTIDGNSFDITIEILACASPSTSPLTDCKLDPIGIVWVNQEGGRQSYWFNQPKDYEIQQSGGTTWINSDKELRYLQRGRVENAVRVSQQFVPIEHIDSLNSLKNSIQAWTCTNILTASTYRSIIIDEDSWVVKRTLDRFYTIEFTFKYSIEKKIQKQ